MGVLSMGEYVQSVFDSYLFLVLTCQYYFWLVHVLGPPPLFWCVESVL